MKNLLLGLVVLINQFQLGVSNLTSEGAGWEHDCERYPDTSVLVPNEIMSMTTAEKTSPTFIAPKKSMLFREISHMHTSRQKISMHIKGLKKYHA